MVSKSAASALEEFRRLYDAGSFFAAHEVLEDAWRAENGDLRERLHGLIHGAVARYHHQRGNTEGAARQCVRAQVRLENSAEDAEFLRDLAMAVAPSAASLDGAARERLGRLEARLRQEQSKGKSTDESAAEARRTLED